MPTLIATLILELTSRQSISQDATLPKPITPSIHPNAASTKTKSSLTPAQADGSLHGSTPPSARRRRQQREAANGAAAHIDINMPPREPLLLSWEDICCTVPAPASPGGTRRILQVPARKALILTQTLNPNP